MAPTKTQLANVDDLPDARRTYVYMGPSKVFYASAADSNAGKGVTRGESVTLDGAQLRQAVRYGMRFTTKEGTPIRTAAQIEAMENPENPATAPGSDGGVPVASVTP